MKEFLLNNTWIFGVIGFVISASIFYFMFSFKSEKFDEFGAFYFSVIIFFGSIRMWTDFFKWLLK